MTEQDETVTCEDQEEDENQVPAFHNAISEPMATGKLQRRLFRLVAKAGVKKDKLIRGLKNVQTRLRKGDKGLCILAADVTPIEVYCHLPVVCEDQNVPYCFVTSKRAISACVGAKRPCIVALIKPDPEYQDLYAKCSAGIEKLN